MKKAAHSRSKQHVTEVEQPMEKKKRPQSKQESSLHNQPPYQSNGSNGTYSQNRAYQFATAQYNNNGNSHNESHLYYRNYQDVPAFSRVRSRDQQIKQSVSLLRERLLNIQQHYEQLIQEEKAKNIERSQIILGLIDEMQLIHQEKVANIKKTIQESQEQKKDVGQVDDKMNEIKGNIDDLISQSNTLKTKNDELQHKIQSKAEIIRQKQAQLQEINKELLESRNEVEQFQLSTLKNNKINREIKEIFDSANTYN